MGTQALLRVIPCLCPELAHELGGHWTPLSDFSGSSAALFTTVAGDIPRQEGFHPGAIWLYGIWALQLWSHKSRVEAGPPLIPTVPVPPTVWKNSRSLA